METLAGSLDSTVFLRILNGTSSRTTADMVEKSSHTFKHTSAFSSNIEPAPFLFKHLFFFKTVLSFSTKNKVAWNLNSWLRFPGFSWEPKGTCQILQVVLHKPAEEPQLIWWKRAHTGQLKVLCAGHINLLVAPLIIVHNIQSVQVKCCSL